MSRTGSPPEPRWGDAAALILLCGAGAVAWWGDLGSGLLWLAAPICVAALAAAGIAGLRPAAIVGVAWLPGALLAAGLPLGVLAPAALGGTVTSLRIGAQALPTVEVALPLLHQWALAAALLIGGSAAILGGIAWRSPRRTLTVVGLTLLLVPLGGAIAMGQVADSSWLGAVVLVAVVLRFAHGRFVPIAVATSMVGAVALFGAQVAAPRAGWMPFGHHAAPAAFHELSTKQTYGPLEGRRTGSVMLEVTSPRPALWRMQVLEAFDNRRWRVATEDTHLPEPAARRQAIKVEVRGLRNRLVVSSGRVTGIRGVGETAVELGEGRLLFDKPPEGEVYRVEADTVHVPLARLAAIPVPIGRRYMAVTQIGLGPLPAYIPIPLSRLAMNMPKPLEGTDWARLFRLSARLSDGVGSQLQLVRRVERYLMRGGRFHYTTEVGPPGEEPLLEFLFHTHRGYCQQFAGAAALLLRVSGVPSRVAVGFATGEQIGPHTWAVRDEDAHAWIEVYFPSVGWVPFNPTPAAAQADVAPGIDPLQPAAVTAADTGGATPQLAGGAAALLLLLGAGRLITGRRGPRTRLTEFLVRLSPQPPSPRTTLRSLHPTLTEIGPATADLAFVAERARFAPGGREEPPHPGFTVWRALISDLGFLRASALMLRAGTWSSRS